MTVSILSGFGINILGFTVSSAIDKAPIYTAANGEKVWLTGLYDSFRVTRVDTKETVELHRKENVNVFINSAFDKSGTVEYLGFKFDKSDGEALINIMEKYKDD